MTRTDARRVVHDDGPHPDETARQALERLLALPYPDLEAAVADGTFERVRLASLAESGKRLVDCE